MTHGVMVALRFLVPSVKVRVLVGQQANFKNPVNIIVCRIFYLLKIKIFTDFEIKKILYLIDTLKITLFP